MPVEEISALTSTLSPPTCLTMSAYTSVEASTLTLPFELAEALEPEELFSVAQPVRKREVAARDPSAVRKCLRVMGRCDISFSFCSSADVFLPFLNYTTRIPV